MNTVVLIGRLVRDPELSYTPQTQTAACRMTLAVDKPKKNGEDQGADFFRITAWGRQAELCQKYLSKGRQVGIKGRLSTGSYTNKNGVKVDTVEVIAEHVEFIGTRGENLRSDGGNNESGNTYRPDQQNANYGFSSMNEPVPF